MAVNELGLQSLEIEHKTVAIWFWGLVYIFFLFALPVILTIKEWRKRINNPMGRDNPIIAFVKAIALYIPLGYALSKIIIALGDEIGLKASYYLSLFLQALKQGQ